MPGVRHNLSGEGDASGTPNECFDFAVLAVPEYWEFALEESSSLEATAGALLALLSSPRTGRGVLTASFGERIIIPAGSFVLPTFSGCCSGCGANWRRCDEGG